MGVTKIFEQMNKENYDWRKEFSRIREMIAKFINNDVTRPNGEFYVVPDLPPPQAPAEVSKTPPADELGQIAKSS